MKKLLDMFSLFFTVISICAATLVCYIIFVYPNLGNNSSGKNKNIPSQNTAVIQADNNTGIVNAYQDTYSPPEMAPDSNPVSYQDNVAQTVPETATNNNISQEYQSALNKANDYSNIMYMSKASIYDQLTSDYGERLTPDAAQYAIDNINADWNFNALQTAKNYSNTMYMSRASIYDQLVSEYGERFTPSEAQYAVDNVNADWSFNALQTAKNYSDTMYMSKAAIYDQLISDYGEKFTASEAQYAVDNLTTNWNYNALQKAKDYQTTMNMSSDAIREQLISEYGERFTPAEADYAVSNISSANNTTNNSVLYTMPVEQGNSNTNYVASNPVPATGGQSTNENNLNTYSNTEQQQPVNESSTMVWIDDTARRYHKNDGCNMDNPYMVTLEEAIAKGKTPCGNCYK